MPFISKDWRSPGEEWVRYEGGWELKKTVLVNSFQKDAKDLQEGCEDQGADSQVRSDQVHGTRPMAIAVFLSEMTRAQSYKFSYLDYSLSQLKDLRAYHS